MTDYKYTIERIIYKIVNSTTEPPKDVSPEYLDGWLSGSAKRQNDIIDMLEEMYKAED